MKFFIIVIISFFSVFSSLRAQQLAQPEKAAIGTFQIVQNPKARLVFTTENYDQLLIQIEQEREENNEKTLWLDAANYVRILPKNIINAPNFQPLIEFVDE